MPVKCLLCALLIAACAPIQKPTRIALLAPFEGRYREIGYEALYAARLALHGAGTMQIEFLPIDDGGTKESAADRAHALALDPQVQIALVLGLPATDPQTLAAFDDIPVLIVGNWGADSAADNVFDLSNPVASEQFTVSPRTGILELAQSAVPLVAGDLLSMQQFVDLRPDMNDVTILSSATLPDADFSERYRASDPFAPAPCLFATATYDAVVLALDALQSGPDRAAVTAYLDENLSAGAPIYAYTYDANGDLLSVDSLVE